MVAADRPDERQAVSRAAQRLRLQGVMAHGPHKTCMINGAAYREGEQVAGFTVENIRDGAVVVRTGRYRFELTMQQ